MTRNYTVFILTVLLSGLAAPAFAGGSGIQASNLEISNSEEAADKKETGKKGEEEEPDCE